MAKDAVCPKCGGVMPGDAPQGLCPACLMAFALGDGPVEPSSERPRYPTRTFSLDRPGRTDPDRSTVHDGPTLPSKVTDPHDSPTIGLVTTFAGIPAKPTSAAPRSLGAVRYFGDYELLSEIARGGMGVVYRARQVSLNRPVALKMILAGQLAGDDAIRRFHLEAEAAANLDHPGIVPIYEIGEHDGQHFFSMGFVEGTSLAARVAEGPLPPREAATLTRQVAEAMHYAHDKGVIHRDLKPGNVLLDRAGHPKVTDFGLAKKLQGDSGLTQTGQVMGTPSYMPPEQAEGKDVGPLADVYALGAILYCLLTGRPPFQAASPMDTLTQVLERDPLPPRQLNPGVPRDLETIALKAMEKQPRKRYESAAALGADLERWLRGEPILARPVGRAEKVTKWVRRRPVIAGLSVAVVVIGLVGLSGILLEWQRAERNFAESEKNRETAESQAAEAKAQRKLAEANFEEAKAQRKLAEAKTAEAQARADELERQGYVSLIAISQRETQANNVALSDRLLDRCPPHLRGWEWRYCSRVNHSELAAIRPQGHDFTFLATPSPDKQRFACQNGKDAWICDLEGKELVTLGKHPEEINCIAWSPDGKTIATGYRDHLIRLWDAESGEARGILRGHTIWVTALCFSPDGRMLLSSAGADPLVPGRHNEVRIWEIAEQREIRTLMNVNGGGVASVAFAPDGKHVAAGTGGGGAHVWETETFKQIHVLVPSPHQGHIESLQFSPDSRLLAAGSEAGGITLWDIDSGSLVRNFDGHVGGLSQIRFSRDGRRIASSGEDGTIRLWIAQTGRQQAVLHGHTTAVRRLEFDPSETRLLSSGYDGVIRVWDATIETHPAAITGHLGWTESMAFHPDGKTLASAGWGGIYLWDVASGRKLGTIHTGHPSGRPSRVAYSADGTQLAAVGDSPLVQIWDTTTRELIHSSNLNTKACSTVAYTADGKNLIIGDSQGYIRIWNIASASEMKSFRAHDEAIAGTSLASDGHRLVTSTKEDLVKVWNLDEAQELLRVKTVRSYGGARAIAVFDRPGERLAVLKPNNTVAILDARNGWVLHTLEGHSSDVNSIAFSPDGRRLATGGSDLTVRVWDTARYEEMITLRGRQGNVTAVGWSSDGRYLAAVGSGEGQIWDAGPQEGSSPETAPASQPQLARHQEIEIGNGKGLARIAYSPDGMTIAIGCENGDVHLWDTNSRSVRATLRGLKAPAVALAFSPDGTILATGSAEWKESDDTGQIKLWDPRTGAFIADLAEEKSAVWALTFSPDGKTLASGSADGLIRLWDPTRRIPRARLVSSPAHWVRGLRFTPDGKFLASSHMALARLWDLETQKPIAEFDGHSDEINSLAISPDGKLLATVSRDQTAVLWDLTTSKKVITIGKERGWVSDAAFSADGKSLVFSVMDGSVKLWDIKENRLRSSGRNPGGFALSVSLSPDGKTVASAQAGLVLWRFGD